MQLSRVGRQHTVDSTLITCCTRSASRASRIIAEKHWILMVFRVGTVLKVSRFVLKVDLLIILLLLLSLRTTVERGCDIFISNIH